MLEAKDFDEVFITKVENSDGDTKLWRCTIKKNFGFLEHIMVTATGGTRKSALAKAKYIMEGAEENYYNF